MIKRLLIIGAIALTLACSSTKTPEPSGESINYPDTQLDDATITFTEDGIPTVLVNAKHIDRWEKQDSTEADTVELYFYDKTGVLKSTLEADRGLIREKSEAVSLYGNVVAVNEDSTILKTQSLFWDPETNLITTDDFVEVERQDGDVVTGYGMKADRLLHEIEILRDVKGKVFDLSVEKEDTTATPDTTVILDTPETKDTTEVSDTTATIAVPPGTIKDSL